MHTYDYYNNNEIHATVVQSNMSKPHTEGTNGQYNDEYDKIAFEKTRKKHYIPRKVNYDLWENAPSRNVANLPASCDDEMYDDCILTTVDLSTVRNAAANSLMALDSQSFLCSEAEVTKENCLRVSDFD